MGRYLDDRTDGVQPKQAKIWNTTMKFKVPAFLKSEKFAKLFLKAVLFLFASFISNEVREFSSIATANADKVVFPTIFASVALLANMTFSYARTHESKSTECLDARYAGELLLAGAFLILMVCAINFFLAEFPRGQEFTKLEQSLKSFYHLGVFCVECLMFLASLFFIYGIKWLASVHGTSIGKRWSGILRKGR